MIKRLCLVLLAFVSLLIPRSATAQTNSLPYVFYYSDDRRAFVIERADGEDTRLLGEGLFPEKREGIVGNIVDGPGWSPSGTWLAWSRGDGYSQNTGTTYPYLIKGNETVSIPLTGYQNPAMAWAPHRDLLLVAGESTIPAPDYYVSFKIGIYEPDTAKRTIVIPDMLAHAGRQSIPMNARWLDDSRYLVYFTDLDSNKRTVVIVGNVDGTHVETVFFNAFNEAGLNFPAASQNGNIAYPEQVGFTVENLATRQETYFQEPSSGIGAVGWSPDSSYAVLYGAPEWLLDMRQKKAIPIQFPNNPNGNGFHGLPEWSSDSRTLILRSGDTAIYQVNLATAIAEVIDSKLPDPSIETLSPDGKLLAWMRDGAIIKNLQTDTLHLISPSAFAYSTFSGGEVRWNADSDWLMTFDYSVIAGGGPYFYVEVVRKDGTMRRDLTWTDGRADPYYNFLPARVKLDDLPPPLPTRPTAKPLKRLLGMSGWLMSLVWSPDNKEIMGEVSQPNYPYTPYSFWRWNVQSGYQTLAYRNADGVSRISWQRLRDGTYISELVPENPDGIAATSPDHHYNVDYRLQVHDYESGSLIRPLVFEASEQTAAAFSPDGRWLITGNGPDFTIWKTGAWDEVRRMKYPTLAIAFSPDGKYIATANGWDIDIWKASDLLPQ